MIESLFPMYIEKLFKDGCFTYLTPRTEYEVVLYKISKQCLGLMIWNHIKNFMIKFIHFYKHYIHYLFRYCLFL